MTDNHGGPWARRPSGWAALVARDRAWAEARRLDEATVALLSATSGPVALMLLAYEERIGRPAYDADPWVAGRELLLACGECGRRFWYDGAGGGAKRYCSGRCRERAKVRRWRARAAVA